MYARVTGKIHKALHAETDFIPFFTFGVALVQAVLAGLATVVTAVQVFPSTIASPGAGTGEGGGEGDGPGVGDGEGRGAGMEGGLGAGIRSGSGSGN